MKQYTSFSREFDQKGILTTTQFCKLRASYFDCACHGGGGVHPLVKDTGRGDLPANARVIKIYARSRGSTFGQKSKAKIAYPVATPIN